MAAKLSTIALAAVLALLCTLLTPAPASAGPDDAAGLSLAAARTGTVVVTVKAPAGVPGVVWLTSKGRKRVVTKRPSGASVKVVVRLPAGRWKVAPQQVVDASAIYTGAASRNVVRVRAGTRTRTTVSYRRAPSVSDLHVTLVEPSQVGLAWRSPSSNAQLAVRMSPGTVPPATPGTGTAVPVSASGATATGLVAEATYAFSVFARAAGTTRWIGPVSTVVTTPASVTPDAEGAIAVTNPSTLMVDDPDDVDVAFAGGVITASVPPGAVPTVGQPWVLPPGGELPSGFVGLVTRIAADGRSVTLAAGGLADAFDYLEVHAPDLAGLPARAGPARAGGAAGALREQRALLDCGGSASESIVVTPEFDPFGYFHATLTKRRVLWKNVPVGMSFDARFGVQAGVSADIELEVGASCALDLPSIAVTIPAGPIPIVYLLEPEVSVGVSGTVKVRDLGFTATLGAGIDGYLGLGGEDHVDGDLIAEAAPLTPSVEEVSGSLSLTAGVSATVGPGLANPKAGAVVGISATLDPIQASATASAGSSCLELAAQRTVSLSIEAKAWLGSWDFSRSVSVPGLDSSEDWGGSPWSFPAGCGPAEYRLASGTLDVSTSWSGGCTNNQGGWCSDDGDPQTSYSYSFSESSDARLRVAEPGEWVAGHLGADPVDYLRAPMVFSSWDYDHESVHRSSVYGCSSTSRDETVGGVEFGGAFWETAVYTRPGAADALDAELYDSSWWSDDWSDQHGWGWGFGAWDTDFANEFPRILQRRTSTSGGECEGEWADESHINLQYLGPAHYLAWPYESRRSSHQVVATPVGDCSPTACSWQVTGTETYQFRSTVSDAGYNGTGSTTVDWSYVVERRPGGTGVE